MDVVQFFDLGAADGFARYLVKFGLQEELPGLRCLPVVLQAVVEVGEGAVVEY